MRSPRTRTRSSSKDGATFSTTPLRDSELGKPERLKYLGPDIWSRRLSLEHRVVYVVQDDRIIFLLARDHY